jgi:hypothetical protein
MGTHYYRTGERGDADLDDGLLLERVPVEDLINVAHWLDELDHTDRGMAASHPRRTELKRQIDYVIGTNLFGGMDSVKYLQSRVRSEIRSQLAANSDTPTPPPSTG